MSQAPCHARPSGTARTASRIGSLTLAVLPHSVCLAVPPATVAFTNAVMATTDMTGAAATAAGYALWHRICGHHATRTDKVIASSLAAAAFAASMVVHVSTQEHHTRYTLSDQSMEWYQALPADARELLQESARTDQRALVKQINLYHSLNQAMCSPGESAIGQKPRILPNGSASADPVV